MKDVAARAGVSISTVSHVLNNTRFVAPATLAVVQKAIGELGFHPNAAGQHQLRSAMAPHTINWLQSGTASTARRRPTGLGNTIAVTE
ncbi:MAG: LacI family DNA-binding transcriptional regulator [Terriglobales bacterium]